MQYDHFQTYIECPPAEVYAWHARPGALERLLPPWRDVQVMRHDGLAEGAETLLRLRIGPVWLRWRARHEEVIPGRSFRDVQAKGPFRHWTHVHRFEPAEPDGERTLLTDALEYELPFGGAGGRLAAAAVRRDLARMFAYRHRVLRADLETIGRYPHRPLRIAVSGASGLIGSALVPFLSAAGHHVLRIVRHEVKDPEHEIRWNQESQSFDATKFEKLDAVIHLAGEDVLAPRWSDQKRMQIYASRVGSTQLLARTLAALDEPPRVFLSASAIGYYGERGDERLDESSAPGDRGFMSPLCQDWEAAAAEAEEAGIRTVQLRMGVVLAPEGGTLGRLLPFFRLGLGGCYGRRHQYVSWIARDDLLYTLHHLLLRDDLHGAFNLTAPHPVTAEEFGRTLARLLRRPSLVRVPPAVVRGIYGEVADETALMSTRAVPARLTKTGFRFAYPDLESALGHMLGLTPAGNTKAAAWSLMRPA